MFSICLTFYNKKILKISAMYYWSSATTQSQHGRKEPLSSSTTPYYLVLRSQKGRRKGWSRLDLSLVPQFRILSFSSYRISRKSQITLSFTLERITLPASVHMKCFKICKVWEISFWNIYHLRELPSRHRYCVSIRQMQMILTKPLQNWLKNLI